MTSQMLDRGERASSGWIGKVLRDGWRIDAKIARGGVATVFRASSTKRRGEHAAIKVLHPELATNADVRQRFLQEGHAANAVDHPGVVRVIDSAVAEDGSAYLVMELLDGTLLEDHRLAAGGILPLSEVQTIGEQLLDVLAAAHEKGIVHRDVKPENLFLLEDGTLKVLDFGVAHVKQTAAMSRDATGTGQLLGTPDYMAPEQANGKRGQIDAQTDLWAVGATLFMLLSGKSVHDAASVGAVLMAAASRPARSLGSVAKDVPGPVTAVVDRALAYEKHKRWPTAKAMKDALREAIARVSSSSPCGPSAAQQAPSSSVNEKKATPSAPGSDPTLDPLAASEVDDNPWDDDDAGRTLATDGPSFELPSNIPSPITVPPPAADVRPPAGSAPVIPKIDFTGPMPGLPNASAPAVGAPAPAPQPAVPPLANPFPAASLGSTLHASPAPPSLPDLSAKARAAAAPGTSGPPSSAKRPASPLAGGAPAPPRPTGVAAAANAAPRAGVPQSNRMPVAPIVAAPTPAPAAAMPAAPPVTDLDDAWSSEQQDDGPTMAIPSPVVTGRSMRDEVASPRSSPMASTGFSPSAHAAPTAGGPVHASRMTDKDAETMASNSPLGVALRTADAEETTRAVSRDELMRHQDAHVVVGEDAMGDEATLAVPPGQIDLGAEGGIAAALVESLRGSQPKLPGGPAPAAAPAFPAPPPQHFQSNAMPASQQQPGGPGMQPPPSWGGDAAQQFQFAQQQQHHQQQQQQHNGPPSFDPMFQQGPQSAPYPPLAHGAPSAQGGPSPGGTNPMMNAGGYPVSQQNPVHSQQPPQRMQQAIPTQQAAPWVTQQSPPPAGMTAPSRFTPQVIMLVAVGVVCLAIFIIGIVLFVTTKF